MGRKDESDGKKTTCEKNGVSLEGEFLFPRAVGEFLKQKCETERSGETTF